MGQPNGQDNPLVHLADPFNPSLFVAKIRDVCVLGDAGDVVTCEGTLLADISFRYPTRLSYERGEHPQLESNLLPPARALRGTYALLASLYAGANYFHLMFNALPRLALLERAGVPLDTLDGLLMNRFALPILAEALGILNIPRSRVIEMDEHAAFELESLWVMPSLLTTGHRRRSLCNWLRTHFLESCDEKPKRRLYLSRNVLLGTQCHYGVGLLLCF